MPLVFLTFDDLPRLARVREVILSVQSSAGRYDRRHLPDGPPIVSSLTNLGIRFCNGGRLSEAEEIFCHAIRIQETIAHRMHHDLIRPLLGLGAVLARRRHLAESEPIFLRALMIAAKAEARIEEHKLALRNLIYIYEILDRQERRNEMLNSLARLERENPFVVKDRPTESAPVLLLRPAGG
jgi:hypothetical protein